MPGFRFGFGFGRQRRTSSGGATGPTTPILTLIIVSGTNASLAIDVDDTVVAGDTVRLQVQATGGNWSSIVSDTTHTITAPEDAANEVDLSLSLANGTYDTRALVHHGTDSAWSNTVTFTISVVSTAITYYLLGF